MGWSKGCGGASLTLVVTLLLKPPNDGPVNLHIWLAEGCISPVSRHFSSPAVGGSLQVRSAAWFPDTGIGRHV